MTLLGGLMTQLRDLAVLAALDPTVIPTQVGT